MSSAFVPLSFAQERLWFLDRLYPGSPLYTIAARVRLKGQLNTEALREAVRRVVARHSVLRSRVIWQDGQAWQAESARAGELAVEDVSERALEARVREEAEKPYDLEIGPMLRATLFRLRPDEHVLLLGMHHIASDWFSFGIFFREVSRHYEAYPNVAELPPLRLAYSEYAADQRRRSGGGNMAAALQYWKNQFAAAPEPLELPADRPRKPARTFRGDQRERRLPTMLMLAFQNLCRREAVTPFTMTLAAFMALLYRLTNQEDICVGTPMTGRDRAGTEQLVGFFSNTVVLRSTVGWDMPFRDLLRQVRDSTLEAMTHQELPFEKLVEELRPERKLNQTPFFQVMFTMQKAWENEIALPGIQAQVQVLNTGTAKFDLTLAITAGPDGWRAEMEFNSDLFDGATIERWLGHLETLLTAVEADPGLPIGKLPLLTPGERERMLSAWNRTERLLPNTSVVELFERQARERANSLAIVSGTERLTFSEVNRRANQIAHHLRRVGTHMETVVAICMARSSEALVAMLAVLKAGGAFLPLDPTDPPERLGALIEDAKPLAILAQRRFADKLPSKANVLFIETLDLSSEPTVDPPLVGHAENLAYVIYTSGSTGQPKGVEVVRRSLLNHALAIKDLYDLSNVDRVLQFAALNFDVAIEEVFPSWVSGSTVVLRDDEMLAPVGRFLGFVAREAITVLNLPTAFWNALVEELPRTKIPDCVRLVVIGGEKASPTHFQKWKERRDDSIRLINAYGLTETTITSLAYAATEEEDRLPIGLPISNTKAFVLDAGLEPTPIGVAGELYIAGEGVARGYLNRAELTAERFIANPFGSGRLYRTGDLARRLANGHVEFLGRADNQVKIRGYRVELGEIESAIREHDAVRDAVVVAREIGNEMVLAAYVTANGGVTADELAGHFRKRLPSYMVPATITLLPALPLTANGKVDRRGLPEPQWTEATGDVEDDGPRTEVEKALTEIWRDLLRLTRVGIHDNFFRLGGHSLLAIKLLSRINQAYQIDAPMSIIFEAPAIAQLAKRIEHLIAEQIDGLTDEQAATLAGREG